MSDPARAHGESVPVRRAADRQYWRVDFEGDEVPDAFLDAVLDTLVPDAGSTPSGEAGAHAEAPCRVAR